MRILIDSQWIDKEEQISVYDPFDRSLIDTIPKADRHDVERVLSAAEKGSKIRLIIKGKDEKEAIEVLAALLEGELDQIDG